MPAAHAGETKAQSIAAQAKKFLSVKAAPQVPTLLIVGSKATEMCR